MDTIPHHFSGIVYVPVVSASFQAPLKAVYHYYHFPPGWLFLIKNDHLYPPVKGLEDTTKV
jgi:hypothetical protein